MNLNVPKYAIYLIGSSQPSLEVGRITRHALQKMEPGHRDLRHLKRIQGVGRNQESTPDKTRAPVLLNHRDYHPGFSGSIATFLSNSESKCVHLFSPDDLPATLLYSVAIA